MEATNRLTREAILAAQDIHEMDVPVPQWGGTVRIRTFTLDQLEAMQKASTGPNPAKFGRPIELDREEYSARLFIEGVVDPKFDLEDYELLRKEHSAVAISTIMKALLAANGLSEDAVAEADKSPQSGQLAKIRVPANARNRRDDARGDAAADVSA